jgi:NitT/TauT family transport system permease protein
VSIVLSVVGAVVGEYVGANKGLGALIIASQGMMDTPLMFAVFVVLTLLGIVLYLLVQACERRVMIRRTRIEPVVLPEPLTTPHKR